MYGHSIIYYFEFVCIPLKHSKFYILKVENHANVMFHAIYCGIIYYLLKRPMFVDCQNFAGSWGRNFVGNWFVALQCKGIHYFL